MKILSSRELIRKIEADGWPHVRTASSHHHFRHPTKPGTVTVPHPVKTLKRDTQKAILRAAGLK